MKKIIKKRENKIIEFFKKISNWHLGLLIFINLGISILAIIYRYSVITNALILGFVSYVLIFIILILKIIPKIKNEYKNKNFIKAGKSSLISLILMVIILINIFSFLIAGDPYEHLLFLYFIPCIILFCIFIIGAILIIIGAFYTERRKISISKKILCLLLATFMILIAFLLLDATFTYLIFTQWFLKNLLVMIKNEAFCTIAPSLIRQTCYTEIAIAKKDIGPCDSYANTLYTTMQKYSRFPCYRDVAVATKNESICELIPKDRNEDCYTSLAIIKKDDSLCYKVKEEDQNCCFKDYKIGKIKTNYYSSGKRDC